MIPIFKDDTTRNPLSFDGLTFNRQNGGTDGEQENIIEVNRVIPSTTLRGVVEARQQAEGLIVGPIYKSGKVYALEGMIRHATYAGLHDLIASFSNTFDPGRLNHAYPSTFGFKELDFDVPTADTSNFADGLAESRLYVRPLVPPDPQLDQMIGLSVPFTLQLLLREPVRYIQGQTSRTGAGTLTMAGNHPTWPTVTITMSGAGSDTFAIGNSTEGKTLTLDLSGRSNGEVVTIDMLNRRIEVDGVLHQELFVSGDYWHLHAGANTITVANGTNASAVVAARAAFSY